MESHLGQAGVSSFCLTCVENGIASPMLSTSLEKSLSFRAVELDLRMPQEEGGREGAGLGRDRGRVRQAACASGASPKT